MGSACVRSKKQVTKNTACPIIDGSQTPAKQELVQPSTQTVSDVNPTINYIDEVCMIQARDRASGSDAQIRDGDDAFGLSPFFNEILAELDLHRDQLGGLKHFKGQLPYIEKKVKQCDLASSYTDYEYVYLTILGIARLHGVCEEIVLKNNGESFEKNPGVQLLEGVAGFTMHADREGANNVLRTAAPILVEGYVLAKQAHTNASCIEFFREGFDRLADPCLEGRVNRLMGYVEKHRSSSETILGDVCPPWEEVSLRPLPDDANAMDIIGEHVRVFMAECIWRWSREQGIGYSEAKKLQQGASAPTAAFERLFNASEFEAWMIARGAVVDAMEAQWQSCPKGSEKWVAYETGVSMRIERAHQKGWPRIEARLGPKSWAYEIDLVKMVQRNLKTKQERELRRVEVPAVLRPGRVSKEDLVRGIEHLVELTTLPTAPPAATGSADCGGGGPSNLIQVTNTGSGTPVSLDCSLPAKPSLIDCNVSTTPSFASAITASCDGSPLPILPSDPPLPGAIGVAVPHEACVRC